MVAGIQQSKFDYTIRKFDPNCVADPMIDGIES